MNSDRIAHLEQFLKDDPSDEFSKYALALEYLNSNKEKAERLFEDLLENHTHYLPTYYHAAAHFAANDQIHKAKTIYEAGITLAQNQNNQHTLRELKAAYEVFLFEYLD